MRKGLPLPVVEEGGEGGTGDETLERGAVEAGGVVEADGLED